MKIRLKYTGELIEVNSEFFAEDGQFLGYLTGDPASPMGEVYYTKEDVAEAPDWAAYRRNAAKDILASLVVNGVCIDGEPARHASQLAIQYADELIKQLKEK